jgi:pimeloyl-ACP methyl ester carboxylesterase
MTALVLALVLPAQPAIDARPLVWVADGAGGLGGCSGSLTKASALCANAVEVRQFYWSHGSYRVVRDQTDREHSVAQGAKLAEEIRAHQKREPGRRVVLVAHSAGSMVALAAAEKLPAGTLDRILLLAPSVSSGYDLAPALSATREGIDVFCSHKDRATLGVGVRIVGTADRGSGRAAGRFGFCAADCAQVRHHWWTPDLRATGNGGGHTGAYAPAFAVAHLFPLIGAK